MFRNIINFFSDRLYPRLAPIIATIGIVGLIICLLLSFLLAKLCEEVWERESFSFDKNILLSIHSFSSPTLDRIMLTITRLGDPEIVVIIVAIFLGWLVWKRYFFEAKIFILACLGAFILNTQMKLVFGRVRPELWSRLIKEISYSFPSGHALGSLVLYGIIAYLLSQHYPRWGKLFYGLAIILIGVIGSSRLYLGVHWPTDIIAGYITGFLWLVICIVMLKLQKIPTRSDKLF